MPEGYKEGDLVITGDPEEKHIMRVEKVRTYAGHLKPQIYCFCITCGVSDSFERNEIRHATKIEKAEYRFLGAV